MRKALFIMSLLVLGSAALSGYLWTHPAGESRATNEAIVPLRPGPGTANRSHTHVPHEVAPGEVVLPAAGVPHPASEPDHPVTAAAALLAETPKVPTGPITTNAMRDVVVTFEQCTLSNRTLRCGFSVVSQAAVEKAFTLGIGGSGSRIEDAYGGAAVFDDLGNDFMSAGGSVGNRIQDNCDYSGSTCRLEKTLTPLTPTPMWIRFDNVESKATSIKLLRVKWSDNGTWVAMDFRNLPISK
jgi:hypothetical protein